MNLVLFSLLGWIVILGLTYFNNKEIFKEKRYIGLAAVSFVLNVVLILTIKNDFGQNILIFLGVCGMFYLGAGIIKAVGKAPVIEDQTQTMSAFGSRQAASVNKDEARTVLIVRIVVGVIAALFIYLAYLQKTDCIKNSEWLTCHLKNGGFLNHLGAIMFLCLCAFFMFMWDMPFGKKIKGNWPSVLAIIIGVVGVLLMFS